MYRLREMDVDDKVCEQVSLTMLSQVYPKEAIERCVQASEPWASKVRRVRLSTLVTLVLFVMGMALWSRRNQCQVWQSLVGQLTELHPLQPSSTISDSGLSGRRQALGSQGLQALMRERCQLIAHPSSRLKSPFMGAIGSWPSMGRSSIRLIRPLIGRPLAAVAINMDREPIRRCVRWCWPSAARMR